MMAKSKRSKKSKNQILEEKLRLRIIVLFGIFAIIVSALRLGFIGQGMHNCFAFLTGHLYGVVYLGIAYPLLLYFMESSDSTF